MLLRLGWGLPMAWQCFSDPYPTLPYPTVRSLDGVADLSWKWLRRCPSGGRTQRCSPNAAVWLESSPTTT